jgi:hypothetical protein
LVAAGLGRLVGFVVAFGVVVGIGILVVTGLMPDSFLAGALKINKRGGKPYVSALAMTVGLGIFEIVDGGFKDFPGAVVIGAGRGVAGTP